MGVQSLGLRVEADHVVGTGENHALDAVQAGCFVDVEGAADIGVEDFLERPLDGDTAEVGDGVDTFAQGMHGRLVGEVAGHDFLVFTGCRSHRRDIGQSDDAGVGLQLFA